MFFDVLKMKQNDMFPFLFVLLSLCVYMWVLEGVCVCVWGDVDICDVVPRVDHKKAIITTIIRNKVTGTRTYKNDATINGNMQYPNKHTLWKNDLNNHQIRSNISIEMKWNEMKCEKRNMWMWERVCVCVWYRVWLLCMTYAWPLSKITFNVTIKAPTQTITNAAAKRTVRWSPGALLYRNLNSNTKKIQNWSLSFSLFKINSIKWNSFHFLSLLFFQFEVFGKSFLSLTKWNESYKWFSHCKKKTNNQWSPKIP